jgi:hypothetical protein
MLNEQCANFIPRFTSMSVAARDAQVRPVVGRALGCRVSADRRKLTVFLCASREAQLLACLRENGAIALTVTRPKTHETLQFKGTVSAILPWTDADRAEIAAYRQSFIEELAGLGYRHGFSGTVLAAGEDGMAVAFEPTAIYDQTPGPKAGAMLETRP